MRVFAVVVRRFARGLTVPSAYVFLAICQLVAGQTYLSWYNPMKFFVSLPLVDLGVLEDHIVVGFSDSTQFCLAHSLLWAVSTNEPKM